MSKLPDHLGGHKNKTHLDEGSLNHMIRMLNVKSMLDIGCGPGGMVELAHSKGLRALGIDGDFTVKRSEVAKRLVHIHDYTKGPSKIEETFDMVWSCEFVEHVEEQYLDNFMQDFKRANFVVMTYAPPGKAGHHHVNCNTEDYWKTVFKNYGFQYDANMTRMIKEVSTLNIKGKFSHKAFVKNNGLCFVKT